MTQRILVSNLGYARGFSGSLKGHLGLVHRNVWCPPWVQKRVLRHFHGLMHRSKADICCVLEIDSGSFTSAGVNQMELLLDETYSYCDIENKYLESSPLRRIPFTRGKSNGFLSRVPYEFEKLYFTRGTKRLVYRIDIAPDITLFFTHFSLTYEIRKAQLMEVRSLIADAPGEVLLMGDFNVLKGLHELEPLLEETGMILLNDPEVPTFFFHRHHLTLDLCLCSPNLVERTQLTVLLQPFSDHAALLVEVG